MPVEEAVGPVEVAHPGQQAAFDERILRRRHVRVWMLRAAAGVPPDLMALRAQLVGKFQIIDACQRAVPVVRIAVRPLRIRLQRLVHHGRREERHIRIIILEELVDARHDGVVFVSAFVEAVGVGVFRQIMLAQFRDVRIQTAFELVEQFVRIDAWRREADPQPLEVGLWLRHEIEDVEAVHAAFPRVEQVFDAGRRRAGDVVRIEAVVQHDVPCLAARLVAVAVRIGPEEMAVHQAERRRIAESLRQREIEHRHLQRNSDFFISDHDVRDAGIVAGGRFAVGVDRQPDALRRVRGNHEFTRRQQRVRQPEFLRIIAAFRAEHMRHVARNVADALPLQLAFQRLARCVLQHGKLHVDGVDLVRTRRHENLRAFTLRLRQFQRNARRLLRGRIRQRRYVPHGIRRPDAVGALHGILFHLMVHVVDDTFVAEGGGARLHAVDDDFRRAVGQIKRPIDDMPPVRFLRQNLAGVVDDPRRVGRSRMEETGMDLNAVLGERSRRLHFDDAHAGARIFARQLEIVKPRPARRIAQEDVVFDFRDGLGRPVAFDRVFPAMGSRRPVGAFGPVVRAVREEDVQINAVVAVALHAFAFAPAAEGHRAVVRLVVRQSLHEAERGLLP